VVNGVKHRRASVSRIKVVEFGDVREDDESVVTVANTSPTDVCNGGICVWEETIVKNRTPCTIY
jgi:hypothetical protein